MRGVNLNCSSIPSKGRSRAKKQIEFKLALWTSSSHVLPTLVKSWLTFFFGKEKLLALRKFYLSWTTGWQVLPSQHLSWSLYVRVTCVLDSVQQRNFTLLVFKVIFVFYYAYFIIRDWGSKLKNRQVKLSDAGSYTCVANNSVGTARTQAFLVVNGMFTFICLVLHFS